MNDTRPPWFDPRMPDVNDSVLKHLLDSRAAAVPQRRLALFEDGSEWSYAQCREEVRCAAAALQALGVERGDPVLVWLPGGREAVRAWFAINYLGAIYVPLNTSYRGAVLQHTINLTGARLMIAHAELIERLDDLSLHSLLELVALGGEGRTRQRLRILAPDALEAAESQLREPDAVNPWDIHAVIYTSGTTGPSKGVLSPYLQLYTTAVVNYGSMEEGECILVNLPLFHVGGTSSIYIALIRAGSFHLVSGFSTTAFWEQVRRGPCVTTAGLIGAMAPFIARSSCGDEESDNPLRHVVIAPVNEETIALGRRFGFSISSGFNMTEVSTPLITDLDCEVHYGCGRPRSGIECRLVDENDMPVAPGQTGELVVRSNLPWTMNAGYLNMPEETARAWRNGWFHTGDVFRQDENGEYFFVDRRKDAIRRRGENVSSMEVEQEIMRHPDVFEAVVVGVPGEFAEEEILAAVVPRAGRTLDPLQLSAHLAQRMAHFMVPRYLRILGEIPKTETNKPRKHLFREQGVTADTWDREAAGMSLKREQFAAP